ncbi:LIC_13387 family protein [Stenotrophobium rhamnosiphilum]|uniref:DUF1304 domain-containing protein n=1 Tax=Stenotrophobium rhamnosiphilum TaxID=2029166 RepID=A0A2T5MIM3_9GAMM|nr:hypothetical protein [Stenotrophobium rhamnosiphilum]PTU32427.1 hypothetical protein CJD38_07195 [Stenotrophobium rhamnosiphilum]
MYDSILILASCAIVFGLGTAHLALTFFSSRFEPRDANLAEQLRTVSPIISRQTTMWRAAQGFHVSHSMGPMLLGLIYGYLTICHFEFLKQSTFLVVLGGLTLAIYLVTAKAYWFKIPLRGIALALVLYLLGFGIALS